MRTLTFLVGLVLALPAAAADWPQWRGPNRDGVSAEKGLLKKWPEKGPKLLWKANTAGLGFPGMAVVGGTVYTMGARGEDEYLIAFDGKGKELWATKMGPVFDFMGNNWSYGPNGTPTVAGDLVYGVSSKGVLVCAKKDKGTLVWKIDMPKELKAQVNPVGGGFPNFGWGFSWSPLVDGDHLIITPGGPDGLFAAVDRMKGKVLWRSKGMTKQATYGSPVMATIGGVKQYVTITQNSLVGVSAKDGTLLWESEVDTPYPDFVTATPLVVGNQVYVSVGRGGKSRLVTVESKGGKFEATEEYTKNQIGSKLGGVVKVGNYVYGAHEDRGWMCQDLKSGNLAPGWRRPTRQKVKAGNVITADGLLFVIDEEGKVGLLEASPKGYKELSTFELPELSKKRKPGGKVWSHPTLSDGKLYLRDQELIFCFEVK